MASAADAANFTQWFQGTADRNRQNRLMQQQQAQLQVENQRQNRLLQMDESAHGLRTQQFNQQQQAWQQEQELAGQERERQAAARAAAVGRQALKLGQQDPNQALAFLKRSMPVYQRDFAVVADDVSDLIDDNVPWERRQAYLQQLAAFGEPQRPGEGMPSNVQEWEYYNRLAPDDQRRYLEMKRNQQAWVTENEGVKTLVQAPLAGAGPRVTQLGTLQGEATAAATVEGAKTTAAEDAKAGAAARAGLGKVEVQAQNVISTIDQLLNSRGLPYITGMRSLAPIVPGTVQAQADALAKQIEGQAFLQAFESLKGAGQITEMEGQKATAAMARLQRSQSTRDYMTALNELKEIANTGVQRARRAAAGGQAAQPAPAPASGGLRPGMVEDGYRYRGGDPADPNNWEQVR
jgi:hypothetical protein